jgi:hypothetical protein
MNMSMNGCEKYEGNEIRASLVIRHFGAGNGRDPEQTFLECVIT